MKNSLQQITLTAVLTLAISPAVIAGSHMAGEAHGHDKDKKEHHDKQKHQDKEKYKHDAAHEDMEHGAGHGKGENKGKKESKGKSQGEMRGKGHEKGMREVMGEGKVNKVMAKNKMVNITHEPMPEMDWPKMRMNFRAADGVDFSKLKPGQDVKFTLEVADDNSYVIKEIQAK